MLDTLRGVSRLIPAAILSLAVAGCGEGALKNNDFGPISDIISAVTSTDGTVVGTLVTGGRPADAGGPSITVTGVPSAINGGSMRVTVTSATPFSKVVVSLQFFDGYYVLLLPSPVTTTDLLVGMSQNAPHSALTMLYGVAAQGGPLGTTATQVVNLLRVGSGDVQVSVSWDTKSDVDLHVVDPSNEEVYFGNKTSASGGTLDLDSNAACNIDNVNNENIVWPANGAPAGTYSVHLVYWSACSVAQTNYTVTILVKGQQPQIFSGTLTGAGSSSTPIPIGSFTR